MTIYQKYGHPGWSSKKGQASVYNMRKRKRLIKAGLMEPDPLYTIEKAIEVAGL